MKRSTYTLVVTLALGIAVGAGFVNAMQHVKVTELYEADLVTSDVKEASMFLAVLARGANMGKHYHPGDAFAYILEGTMLLARGSGAVSERRRDASTTADTTMTTPSAV